MKVIVHGVRRAEDVLAAAEAGADAVSFVVESKGEAGNVDITEAVESARLAPPFLAVVLSSSTLEESRLRRAIGSLHPHAVEFSAELDPMILADLQVSFPEVKWFARLAPSEYEPFHDAADALVLVPKSGSLENAAKVREASRSRVILGALPEGVALRAAIEEVRPFGVRVPAGADAGRLVREAKGAA